MQKRKILITGASGFIGSTTVDGALKRGYETWAGIRQSSSRRYLQDGRIGFIDLQYTDKRKLKKQLRDFADEYGRFDDIVHIAGLTKALHKSDFDKVNYEQTRNFVEALIETDTVPDSFVFMSSLGAMGPGDEIGYTPMCADKTPSPNTAYGKSKLKAENWLKGITGFPYLILRPTGVYGPRDRDYLILMRAVKNGLDVGAGFKKQLLSFIYIEDLVNVIFSLTQKGIRRKEYFVADGDLYTDSEFNAIVRDALYKKNTVRLKIPLFLVRQAAFLSEKAAALSGKATTFNSDKYRIMKQRNWACEIAPLKEDIGFQPEYRLKEGVKKTVEWYQNEGWL
ncbi:NAD-dependent epimerase/dehydratase family protein [uncultured Proteiniphilum sp.]|uniref:NAD-dependent epimerase/dehydratase family protein n=1 Tax=uncultured Proteiniphilum sp. TaxID=497637 RepID=UPI0026023A26|nr:NAD-dependent epimerase/dehydratase family protein [uncultured Proteiniphilum sp.]